MEKLRSPVHPPTPSPVHVHALSAFLESPEPPAPPMNTVSTLTRMPTGQPDRSDYSIKTLLLMAD